MACGFSECPTVPSSTSGGVANAPWTDLGVDVALLSARRWHAGGVPVALDARPDERVIGVHTLGRHPALFVYDPRPIWRALGEEWDVLDLHEEPFALATAEVLLLRALRRRSRRTPIVLYTAQNLRKRYPVPFRWLEARALRAASGISACNADAARIVEEKGFAGRARVIPLGVDLERCGRPMHRHAIRGTWRGTNRSLPTVPAPGSTRRSSSASSAAWCPRRGSSCWWRPPCVIHGFTSELGVPGRSAPNSRRARRALGIADRIELVGSVAPDDVVDFYRTLDVLAVPSIPTPSWTEQFGRVAVEAMACGVPVVSSDAGALPDVVGGAGMVVPAGDPAHSALRSSRPGARGRRSSAHPVSHAPRSAAGRRWDGTTSAVPLGAARGIRPLARGGGRGGRLRLARPAPPRPRAGGRPPRHGGRQLVPARDRGAVR